MSTTPYLTRAEVAKRFGKTTQTIDNWRQRRSNPIPHMKIGGSVMFDPAAVERWCQKNKRG